MTLLSFLFPTTKNALRGLDAQHVSSLIEATKPRRLEGQVITEGDVNHSHSFREVEWDSNRLGSAFTDADKDPGTEIAFPMATFKDLHLCSCGREIVCSTRALI